MLILHKRRRTWGNMNLKNDLRVSKEAFVRLIATLSFAAVMGSVGGCVAEPPAPPPPAPFVRQAALPPPSPDPACVNDATGATFVANKVRYLTAGGFKFIANGGSPYTGPTVGSPVNPAYASDFAAAFAAAPPFLRQELCNDLNYVFVDQGNQGDVLGWAFWEVSGQGNGAGRWIAIQESFWNAKPPQITRPPLSTLETNILHELLLYNQPPSQPPFYMVAPSQDTWTNALIALMAHEMGHVLYYEKCDQQNLCDQFLNHGWKDRGKRPPIHKFGDPFDDAPNPVPGGPPMPPNPVGSEPSLKQVQGDFKSHPNDPKKLKWIYGINSFGPGRPNKIIWADLLAVEAPDEDFVETYELMVLDRLLDGLKVQFTANPGDSVDIINQNLRNGNSVLSTKANIIGNLLP